MSGSVSSGSPWCTLLVRDISPFSAMMTGKKAGKVPSGIEE